MTGLHGATVALSLCSLVFLGLSCRCPINVVAPTTRPTKPNFVRAFESYEKAEIGRLLAASSREPRLPFDDIQPTLPISHPFKTKSSGTQFMKSYIAAALVPGSCVVYGFGLAATIEWELHMATEHNCEVHGFDCTSNLGQLERAARGRVKLHPWCVGKERSFEGNYYTRQSKGSFEFLGLADIMTRLGHRKIDVLKFDIEGFEWELFRTEILPPHLPKPTQMLFELHTEGASKQYVPEAVVRGKRGIHVDQLMLQLHDLGYRVFDKDVNPGDEFCAEFSLLRVLA